MIPLDEGNLDEDGSARAKNASYLLQGLMGIRHMFQDRLKDNSVEDALPKGQPLGQAYNVNPRRRSDVEIDHVSAIVGATRANVQHRRARAAEGVDKSTSQRVLMSGAVRQGGAYEFPRAPC
jgi:hypothetical protein